MLQPSVSKGFKLMRANNVVTLTVDPKKPGDPGFFCDV